MDCVSEEMDDEDDAVVGSPQVATGWREVAAADTSF